jgi:hypothetical protein
MSEWKTNKPEVDGAYKVKASDYMGEFEYVAEYVRYKNDKKGSGRWMQRNKLMQLERVQRKEYPEAYRQLTRDEFMEYYGLGEEDMRNDND